MEERLYVAQDANWNVTALINTSGAAVERIVYGLCGKPSFMDSAGADRMPNASSFDWVYLHQGLRFDSVVDLYDNRARAYSPTLMRFLQTDPIGFAAGDGNLFRSRGGNATSTLDPSGLYEKNWAGRLEAIRKVLGATGLDGGMLGDCLEIFADEAIDFGKQMAAKYKNCPGVDPVWVENAARHAYWMSIISIRYTDRVAKLIGEAHEAGEANIDSLVDTHNNAVAIGLFPRHNNLLWSLALDWAFQHRMSLEDGIRAVWGENGPQIRKMIKARIELELTGGGKCPKPNGTLIISPFDHRIPGLPGFSPTLPIERGSPVNWFDNCWNNAG